MNGIDSVERIIQTTPSKRELVINEIKKMMENIPKSKNDMEYFYQSNFSEKFNQNDASHLLKLYSLAFMKTNKIGISEFLESKGLKGDTKSRGELYRKFIGDTNFKGTTNQNLELYSFLIKQFEVGMLVGCLSLQIEAQRGLSGLREELKQQKITPGVKPNPPKIKEPQEKLPPTRLPQKKPNIPQQRTTEEINPSSNEQRSQKEKTEKGINKMNGEIKAKITQDFKIDPKDIPTLYEELSGGEKYKDNIQTNGKLFAMLTIKEKNLNFEEYLQSLGFENTDKVKKALFDKFSSGHFKGYKGDDSQKLTIFYGLILEKEFGENFKKFRDYEKNEDLNKLIKLVDPKKIRSASYELSPSGSTMCSRTANKNIINLCGTQAPTGDAKSLLPIMKANGGPSFSDSNTLKQYLLANLQKGNVFDLYANSDNGHRLIAVACTGKDGKPDIAILDPYYYPGPRGTGCKNFDDYMDKNFARNFDNQIVVNPQFYKANPKFLA